MSSRKEIFVVKRFAERVETINVWHMPGFEEIPIEMHLDEKTIGIMEGMLLLQQV